jgi:hypothetical protein
MQLMKTGMTNTSFTRNHDSHRTNVKPEMRTKDDQTPTPKRRKRKSPKLDRGLTVAPSLPNEPLRDSIYIDDDGIISF